MNDDNFKEEIRARIDLADWVIRDGVPLKGGPNEFAACCPFHTEKTPSFTVFHKEGRWAWYCHGCATGGDTFEYVMRRRGLDFPRALKLLANEVGLAVPERRLYQPPEVKATAAFEKPRGPFDPSAYGPLTPGGKVFTYLTEKRKLTPEILAAYHVGQTADDQAYAFGYKWLPEGAKAPRFEFCKVVKVDRDENGKKIEWRDPRGGKNILFGMLAVPADAERLVIAEGEIDAMTWAKYGYAAVSVPGGAGYLGWIAHCWEWLATFKKIYISFDEDRAGRLKLVEVVTRLGMARTDIVRLPEKPDGQGRYKDANECLQAGVTAEAMAACLENTEVLRPDRLKAIYDFEEDIWQKFHPSSQDQLGLTLPWGNAFGSSLPFRFRHGELTVWTGFNKHGKSEVLNYNIVNMVFRQGQRALVCSLEVQAPETYRKLIRMAAGQRDVIAPEERALFRDKCLRPLADKVWVYDHVGNAAVEDVLNVMLYAYQRYGVKQFVLDSLMRFEGLDGEGQEIWNGQRDFMNKLLNFAETYRVHVHLVAHSKKPGERRGEAVIPRRYDIMGSSYISNLAFNVIVVWRNRAKHDKLEEVFQHCEEAWIKNHPGLDLPPFKRLLGGPPSPSNAKFVATYNTMLDVVEKEICEDARAEFKAQVPKHDAYFIVDAQRGGDGDCPARHLWFHYDSLQFLEASAVTVGATDPRGQPTQFFKLKPTGPAVEYDEAF